MSSPVKLRRKSKALIAWFCVVSSLMTAVINYILMSMYMFPSYQALRLMQIVATLIVLWIGRLANLVRLPHLDRYLAGHVWPLPVINVGIMATSHSGVLDFDLPSSLVWRPISIFITLVFEKLILGVEASCTVQTTVVAMVGGAAISSVDGEDNIIWKDCVLILLNNVHLAAIGVFWKKILNSKVCGVCGLLYIDALLNVMPALIIVWSTGGLVELTNYKYLGDPFLLGHIVMSSLMGIIQTYGVILCTQYNSALTTSVIGTIICIFKYLLNQLGFVLVSWLNFAGFLVTFLGSLLYTYVI